MADSKGEYTRSGARRSGDDYQDLVALDVLVDWLEHPARFQWVKVEGDDLGALDDVVALADDGTLHSRQVKFSTAPDDTDDNYTWDDLLEQEPGAKGKLKPSLIQKWSSGLKKAKALAERCDARIVSNRKGDGTLLATMVNGLVQTERLPTAVQDRIAEQLGSSGEAAAFFAAVRFSLDQPSYETLEERIRRKFFHLSGTEQGWLDLKDHVRAWVRKRNHPPPDGTIRLAHVRSAAGWRELRWLSQEFEVPDDYVLPSKESHDQLLASLCKVDQGCVLIEAPPGYGKSTYASYLFNDLVTRRLPVVRHHYFLSMNDRTAYDRLESDRAAESLLFDLHTRHSDALGAFSATNLTPQQLGDALDVCAKHFETQAAPLVVIVDGLDHVWREKRSVVELERLLRHLLPVRRGVVVLLVSQPVPEALMPPFLRRALPGTARVQIPLLDRGAVEKWTRMRRELLGLAEDGDLALLVDALFRKTEGHPLLLRYTFRTLEARGVAPTVAKVESLPGCVHADVSSYYANLVAALSTAAVGVLHLIAACPFNWPIEGLLHCLASAGLSEPQGREAVQEISHLLVREALGFRPFHASLSVYIGTRDDHMENAAPWRNRALSWLDGPAPDYWRWAYRWTVEADMGSPSALSEGPDRTWVVEAISKRRPKHQVLALLGRSAWLSLSAKHFGLGLRAGLLREYATTAFDDDRGILPDLLSSQLALQEDPSLVTRLAAGLGDLSNADLVELARFSASQQSPAMPERVLAELRRERRRPRERDAFALYVEQVAEAAGLVENPDMGGAVSAGKGLRNSRASAVYFIAFSRGLARKGNVQAMRALASLISEMLPGESHAVLASAAMLGLEQSANVDEFASAPAAEGVPQFAVYTAVRGLKLMASKPFALPKPASLRYEEISQMRPSLEVIAKEIAFAFVANHLTKKSNANRKWIDALEGAWQNTFFSSLDLATERVATGLTKKQALPLADFFVPFASLPSVDSVEDGKFYARLFASQTARGLTHFAAELVKIWPGVVEPLNPEAVQRLSSSPFNVFAWLDASAREPRLVTTAAMNWMIASDQKELLGESFAERAEAASLLAKLALAHGETATCRALVRRSVERLLAHGYHKDMLLFGPLELAQQCHDVGVGTPWVWLGKLAPAIAALDKITDGDETRHLPSHLAEAIARVSPQHLPAYYRCLCAEEEWHTAIAAIRHAIGVLDLVGPESRALAETALDARSLAFIESLASENPGALAVKQRVEELFGPDAFRPDEDEGSKTSSDAASDSAHTEPDPSAHPPGALEDFLESLGGRPSPSRKRALEAWLAHWAKEGQGTEALAEAGEVADASPWSSLGDTLFEFALAHHGKDQAFAWLVRAQRESSGWSAYLTSKEGTEWRWNEVARLYPDRWFEFLRASLIADSEQPWKAPFLTSWQVERVGQYLLRFDRQGSASDFATAAVETAVALVPLALARPSWMDEPVDGSVPLSLLVERLAWPSGLARERAASGVARLLVDSKTRTATETALLQWMHRQGLESVQSTGLVCFVRARDLGGAAALPEPARLRDAVTAPSLLSLILLRDLGDQFAAAAPEFAPDSGAVPTEFQADPFFNKHRQSFVPPVFSNWAKSLEQKTGFPFRAQWAFEWARSVDRERIVRSTNSARYWFAPEDKETLAFDVPMSEAYRSSYLRALARATRVGLVHADAAAMVAAELCPVDFSLWNVEPTRKPHDWPLPSPTPSPVIDLAPEAVWAAIEKWWASQENGADLVTYANGRVIEGKATIDVELWGTFQKCTGPTRASADEAFDELSTRGTSTVVAGLVRLDGVIDSPRPERLAVECGDSQYILAAVPLRPPGIPRWQAWRHFRGWAAPTQALFDAREGLMCACLRDRIEFSSEGRLIGTWSDWTEGVRERGNRHIGPFNGCILRSPRTLVAAFAERNEASFCWVCRVTTHYGSGYSHRKEATYSARQLGGTSLVRPGSWRLVGM